MPKRVPLNSKNLAVLADGTVDLMLQHGLAQAAADCIDRPGDKKARVVSLEFTVVPIPDESGQCETVTLEVVCKTTLPVRRTRPYQMLPTKAGLIFNADDATNIDQEVLNFSEDE